MQFDPVTGTFQQATEMYWGNHCYNSGDAGKGFRTAEAYLNRAEAGSHMTGISRTAVEHILAKLGAHSPEFSLIHFLQIVRIIYLIQV